MSAAASEPSAAAPPRAPRRDALRNDRRVVDAARAVFGERGPQASMEDIAARAGVGVGTIYRRFPSKDALLDAIAAQITDELETAASEALDGDDGHGLETFLEFVGASVASKRRYSALVVERAGQGGSDAMAQKITTLTANAVAAGRLAGDVGADDIHALIKALRPVVANAASDTDDSWRRFLRLHLAGLRVGA